MHYLLSPSVTSLFFLDRREVLSSESYLLQRLISKDEGNLISHDMPPSINPLPA